MNSATPTLASYTRRHAVGIVFSITCVLLSVAFSLASAWALRISIQHSTAAAALDPPLLLRDSILFFGLSIASVIFSLGMRSLPLRVGHQIEYELRRDLFDHLATLEPAFYREQRTGDLMTRMTSDVGMVRDLIGQGLLQGTRAVVVSLGAFGMMFFSQPRLAAIISLLVPPIVLTFFFLLRAIRRRHDAVQEQYSDLTHFSQETFAGIRTVRGFAIEPRREAQFDDLSHGLLRRNLRLSWIQQPLWPIFAFWFGAETAVLLVVGGRMMVRGDLGIGDLVLFQQLLLMIQWPMLSIGWTASLIQRGLASWARLQDVFRRASRICDPPESPLPAPLPSGGDIHFNDVSLEIGGRKLLDRVQLHIPNGQILGITGPTGSGKSTLISLLPRLLDPTSGAVMIGGRDVRTFPLAALRKAIGIAPQEPMLFSDTLAHNLTFGLETPQPDDLHRAADLAHLNEEVLSFPLRYETMLGERGVTLSGGQRQRTAIGRALAKKPPVLILDDTLAAVDTHTEAAILAKLKPVMDSCTTLLVSHRASTLFVAGRVIVIEDGRITADGPPSELAKQGGYFRDLVERQALERACEPEESA